MAVSRVPRSPLRWFLRIVRRLIMRGSVRLLNSSEVHGFRLTVFSGHAERDSFIRKVTAALELIAANDPRRFMRLRRDVKRFALVAAGGDYFDSDIDAHIVDLRTLRESSVVELANLIAHEAVHARLIHAGIPYSEPLKARIEALCVEEEIALATKLPGGTQLIPSLRARLEKPWWQPAESERRIADQLTSLGAPRWLLRIRRILWGPG